MGYFSRKTLVPASQGRIERRNNVVDGVPLVTFRLGADFVPQRHQTFLAHPTLPCFKPIPQKLEPFLYKVTLKRPWGVEEIPMPTLMQLRFASFAVINLRRDFHPQECARAGRT